MVKELYTSLKSQIDLYLPELKGNTMLWNNQFAHSNGVGEPGRNESAFDYPVVFLEFNEFEFRQLSVGVQEFDFILTVRLGYKSFKKEDLNQLDLLERLYWVIQRFQKDSFSRLSRISEAWDVERSDVGITTIKYRGYGKDFNRYVFAESVQEALSGITGTLIYTQLSGLTGTTSYSSDTSENGNNEF